MMVFANSYAQSKPEFVKINWPKAEKWHIADQKKSDAQTMVELLKGNETFDNFTELGTTYSFRSTMYIPVKDKIEELYERVRKIAPTAKKTMIEQDEKAGCPWYLYKIESPTESQVWFAVQGKTELHVSFWAIRAAEVKSDLQDKWVKIFKSATINCK
ncbi:hypothetical protein FNO01nite_26040 [Flavobacterium noncentrifugens]|nr:hypothetical protein FNO01nite_26040 [Flavobacterium noncentrifugens]